MLHPADIPNNLPEPPGSFVGRARAIDEIAALLTESRLVTLVGMGGVGKTRLALQVAAEAMARFPAGAWLVELGPLHEGRRVREAAAAVLGAREEAGEPLEAALARHVAGREMLVIVDSCEHVLEGAAGLVHDLLAAAPGVRVLATSREPLRLPAEATFLVPGLAVPRAAASREAIAHSYAVRLFVDRVRSASPHFALTESNAPSIGAICRLLDGIPLALELAAARMRWIPPARIAAQLRKRLQRLGEAGAALPRRRILQATIDWSHEQLAADERALFRRLAVFAGGWTLEAAESVCDLPPGEALRLLECLADRSLIGVDKRGTRYRMLEPVREYALRRLADATEAEWAADRHLDCYTRLAAAGRRELSGPKEADWLARFDAERDNILAAIAWSAQRAPLALAGLRLANATKMYWMTRGQLHLALRLIVEALVRCTDASAADRAQALFNAGQLRYFMGRHEEACACLEQSLAIARGLGEPFVAAVLQPLGMAALARGDLARAAACFEEAVRLAAAASDKAALAGAMNALAMYHRVVGDARSARSLYDEVVRLARESGADEVEATGLLNLAMVAIDQNHLADARTLLAAAMRIALATGSAPAMQSALDVSAALAAARSEPRRAARFVGAAYAQAGLSGVRRDAADARFLEPRIAATRAALGEMHFAAAESQGRLLDARQALREAQAWLQAAPSGAANDSEALTASR